LLHGFLALLSLAAAACVGRVAETEGPDDAGSGSNDASSGSDDAGKGWTGDGPDTRLFPAEVGRSWTYVKRVGEDPRTPGVASYTVEITGREMVDGYNAFVTENASPEGTYAAPLVVQGDNVYYPWDRERSEPLMKEPVQEGASWSFDVPQGTKTLTWHWVGKDTVTAGTFDECWRLDEVVPDGRHPGSVSNTVACRGVGTIRASSGAGAYTYGHELASKNF
jgi:hypothetical protein